MESDVLIVTHQAVSRTLLAYFLGIPLTDMTELKVPLHTLFCIQPRPYEQHLTMYKFNSEKGDFQDVGAVLERESRN